jgi:hypothetical protein
MTLYSYDDFYIVIENCHKHDTIVYYDNLMTDVKFVSLY